MALCDQLEAQLTTSQASRSRLLEATLRDALGMDSVPAPRLGRPADSPAPPTPLRTEIKHQTIEDRRASPPKGVVQGSLLEKPTPTPAKPSNNVPGAILAHMEPYREYSRAQLCDALGLTVYEWNMAIRELKESGRVAQVGERRGARYSLMPQG